MNFSVPAAYSVKSILFIRGHAVHNPNSDNFTQDFIKCHLTENISNRITLYKQHAAILAGCNKPDAEALQETDE
jgi:hypothetical protein